MPLNYDRTGQNLQEKDEKCTWLDLSCEGLFDEDIEKLVELIKKNKPNLEELILRHNNFGSKSAILLASITSLKTLDVSYNNIDDKAAESLAKSGIINLNLDCNNLTGLGAFMFVQYGKQKKLILDRNRGISYACHMQVDIKIEANKGVREMKFLRPLNDQIEDAKAFNDWCDAGHPDYLKFMAARIMAARNKLNVTAKESSAEENETKVQSQVMAHK